MTVEVDPSARIQVRQSGMLMHPGCCTVCGYGGPERDYVDPAIFFDYEGQIYFCTECATQIGETIGMCTAAEFAHLKALYEEYQSRLLAQEAELHELRDLRDSIIRVAGSSLSNNADGVAGEVVNEPAGSELISEPVVSESPDSGENEQPELTESSESVGSNDAARTTSSDGRRPTRARPIV